MDLGMPRWKAIWGAIHTRAWSLGTVDTVITRKTRSLLSWGLCSSGSKKPLNEWSNSNIRSLQFSRSAVKEIKQKSRTESNSQRLWRKLFWKWWPIKSRWRLNWRMTKGSSVKNWGIALKAGSTQKETFSITGKRRSEWLERNEQGKTWFELRMTRVWDRSCKTKRP